MSKSNIFTVNIYLYTRAVEPKPRPTPRQVVLVVEYTWSETGRVRNTNNLSHVIECKGNVEK